MKSGTGFTNVKLRGQAQTENINNVVTVRIQMNLNLPMERNGK